MRHRMFFSRGRADRATVELRVAAGSARTRCTSAKSTLISPGLRIRSLSLRRVKFEGKMKFVRPNNRLRWNWE
eukprot:6182345-Pleurochrysis_carterae.AAC.1